MDPHWILASTPWSLPSPRSAYPCTGQLCPSICCAQAPRVTLNSSFSCTPISPISIYCWCHLQNPSKMDFLSFHHPTLDEPPSLWLLYYTSLLTHFLSHLSPIQSILFFWSIVDFTMWYQSLLFLKIIFHIVSLMVYYRLLKIVPYSIQ